MIITIKRSMISTRIEHLIKINAFGRSLLGRCRNVLICACRSSQRNTFRNFVFVGRPWRTRVHEIMTCYQRFRKEEERGWGNAKEEECLEVVYRLSRRGHPSIPNRETGKRKGAYTLPGRAESEGKYGRGEANLQVRIGEK